MYVVHLSVTYFYNLVRWKFLMQTLWGGRGVVKKLVPSIVGVFIEGRMIAKFILYCII